MPATQNAAGGIDEPVWRIAACGLVCATAGGGGWDAGPVCAGSGPVCAGTVTDGGFG